VVAKSEEVLMSRYVATAMLLCFGLLGCKNAAQADLTGMWVVTDQSRQRFLPASQRSAAATIALNTDGTFTVSELPEDLLYGPPDAADRLVTGNGIWKLVSREGRQQVQLEFNTITAGQRGNVPYGTMLNVSTGLGSRVALYYFQGGDADQGRRVEFKKK
jgi:hypothetical protein